VRELLDRILMHSRDNCNAGPPRSCGAADHFAEHCSVCHGADGRGRSTIGGKMYPPVPDLGSEAVQQYSDGALFAIIRNGVRWTGMPAFRSSDSDEEIWKLVSFIRRVPTLTAEDLARHDDTSGCDDGPATRSCG
jgi:cytochrome c